MEDNLLGKKRERDEDKPCFDRVVDNILSSNPRLKHFCSNCDKNITRQIKILSEDGAKLVCLACLLEKRESLVGNAYFVFDSLKFNLISKDWTAEEELELVRAVRKSGLDNWIDMKPAFRDKVKAELENHYFTFYIGDKAKLEDSFIFSESEDRLVKNHIKLESNTTLSQANLEQCRLEQGRVPEISKSVEKGRNSTRQVIRNRNSSQNKDSANDIVGYWPRRKEFDIEFLNDAEVEICDVDFSSKDTESEAKLKLDMLKCYLTQLDEREKRKEWDFKQVCYKMGFVQFEWENEI